MRVSLIIGLLGLSGCSAMATMQTDLESQPAVVSEKPQPSNPAPQKVNPITGQMAGESELDRALQRLVDDLELAVMRMPSGRYRGQDGVGPGGIHVVQEGEYLDLIIEKTLPGSPIRQDLLRKAFVKLNPSAFGGRGNPNYIFAKKKLKVPSVADLKAVIFKAGELEQLRSNSANPHQGWIQYP